MHLPKLLAEVQGRKLAWNENLKGCAHAGVFCNRNAHADDLDGLDSRVSPTENGDSGDEVW